MITVQRLKLAGAVLALTGIIVSTQVWGDAKGDRNPIQPSTGRTDAPSMRLGEALASEKFAHNAVVSYRTTKGDTLIAAQIKPALEVPAARPRDLAVLIDASASQAGNAFGLSRKITSALQDVLNPNDRVSIWIVSTPAATKCLTGSDFQAPKSEKIADALNKLETVEYAAGATDLKNAVRLALASFDIRANKQAAILLLGDGESAYSPITNPERYQISQELIGQKVAFFAVPLGVKLNPTNLHGFASSTGGAIVRLQTNEQPADLCKRVLETVSAPILYPTKYTLADGTLEALPTKLPPLRSDSPTLMVGKVKPGAETFALKIEGAVAGKATTVEVTEKITASEKDNYFLVSMFDQWNRADNKAAPALIRADRALAYAMQQTRMTVDEYLTSAQWALSENRYDVADQLFGLALKLDPTDDEATNGKKVVELLKGGKVNRKQMFDELVAAKKGQALKIAKEGDHATSQRVDYTKWLVRAEADPPAAPPATEGELLKQAQQARQLAEQQTTSVVEETLRRAKTMLNSDPDGAYDLLKRQRASLSDNPEIGDAVKQRLLGRIDTQMRDVDNRGRAIKQELEARAQQRIKAERDLGNKKENELLEFKTRERVRAFVTLMNQARYEEAYKESLVLQQEHVAKGQPVPIEATASYALALNATNLRELQELKRIREERFLLTMMQVEKSHVPYPDEPPVHFPPATVWKQLSEYRKSKYDASGLGPETPAKTKELSSKLSKAVDIEKPIDATLKDVLEFLSDRFDLTIIVDPVAFGNAEPPLQDVEGQKVKLPKLPGVTLGTILRLVLSPIGGTYIVRRDYIEITTAKEAIREKTVRAYEVADLVIPLPNSINQLGLNQNLNVLGGSFSFGQAGSQFTGAAGALGFLGAAGIGGGIGGLGIGGIGGGGLGLGGGIGGGGLGLGGGIGGMGGQQGNFVGFGGFGGQGNNLGAGGGLTGFGGGQLGQFGNLGGQFGLQGGDQSALLITLITDVVARGEWARVPTYVQQQLGQGNMMGMDEPEAPIIPASELNSLGYYPPARALVVRATSRVHTRLGGGLLNPRPAGGGNMGMAPGQDRPVLVFGGPKSKDDVKQPEVAKVDPKREIERATPKGNQGKVTAKDWHAAFAKADIKDKAGWVIALCHMLGEVREFSQAADVLKTNLRQGFVNEPWVFEALAIALEESKATSAEIERARLSAIDLEPKDPHAYLRAAKAMAEMNQSERAVAFCRQAAALQPGLADPYANALVYLEKAKTVDTDAAQWAVSNLLSRDWSTDSDMYRDQAHGALETFKTRLTEANRKADVERLQSALTEEKRRDLVIELSWQGDADLDLRVVEPIGTTCSTLQRQTPAGSLLSGDLAAARVNNSGDKEYRELYTVAEGFNGTYEVKVDRVWGRPTSGRALVKVTRHQGTPDQQISYHTIVLDQPEAIKIPLSGGRRTALASVPPPIVATGHPDKEKIDSNTDRAVNRLRALADPTYSGGGGTTLRSGGVGTAARQAETAYDLTGHKVSGRVSYETNVDSTAPSSIDLTAKAQIETNRKGETEIHLKMAPIFQTARFATEPTVNNPLIPGSK